MTSQFILVSLFLSSSFVILANSAAAYDWPALRGDGTGHGQLTSQFANATALRLQPRWKKPLGSGFSSVVIADERVFAMYSDGVADQLVCLDANNGEAKWQVSLGETFEGKNGSFDGPLATPVVHEDLIFAFNGYGVLRAYKVTDGSMTWSIDLVEEHSAVRPLYGFATSPIVSRGVLVVQHGASDAAVMGIEPSSGNVKWKAARGAINSQSPAVIRIGADELVTCCCGKDVFGIDVESGEVRFQFSHQGGNGSAMVPVQISEDTILLTDDDSFSEAYELSRVSGDQIDARQKWKERTIKNTYNVPCTSTAGVLAFSTRILTCIDPETGRAKWKSRDPGDGFLVTAGKWLFVGTKDGGLHLAEINDEGYREVSQVQLFDEVMWSIPAITDNAIFLRSLGEIARVDLVPVEEQIVANNSETMPLSDAFRQFVEQLSSLDSDDSRDDLIEAYLSKVEAFPIIEDGVAHFVYRGPGNDVALACDAFGARQEQSMVRIPNTNLFYYGLKLPPAQRMNYMFLVDFKPTVDPLNPRTMTSTVYAGEMEFAVRLRNDAPLQMSWFGMSEFELPRYLDAPEGKLRGTLIEEKLAIDSQSEAYPLSIYLPPDYETDKNRTYPVVFIFDSANAKTRGDLPGAVDRMLQLEMAPASILVFLDGGTGRNAAEFADTLADDVLPFLNGKYRLDNRREARVCWGTNFAAGGALAVFAARPDTFGAAAIQSPLVFDDARNQAADALRSIDQPVKLYLEWGRYDMFNPVENWDVRSMSQEFVDAVKSNPNVTFRGGQVDDTTDWSSWRNRYDVLFRSLLE